MEAMNDDQMSVSEITWQHVRGRTSYDEGVSISEMVIFGSEDTIVKYLFTCHIINWAYQTMHFFSVLFPVSSRRLPCTK